MPLRYLLTSNFPGPGNDASTRFLSACKVAGPIAWVSPQLDTRRFAQACQAFADLGFGPLVDASVGPSALGDDVGAIYLSGGEPVVFRERLQTTGMAEWLRQNATAARPRPVIAASGGAMQLTPNVSAFRLLTRDALPVLRERSAFAGLNLVPFEVVPHLDSQPNHLLQRLDDYARGVNGSIWGLGDGSALACLAGGKVVALGNATLVKDVAHGP